MRGDWARALFAGVLAVALLLPSLDFCICANDLGLSDATPLAAAATVASAPSRDADDCSGVYCHCLHPAGLARLDLVALETIVTDARVDWAIPDSLRPIPGETLLRPPRV